MVDGRRNKPMMALVIVLVTALMATPILGMNLTLLDNMVTTNIDSVSELLIQN